jgi:hypothetical protein
MANAISVTHKSVQFSQEFSDRLSRAVGMLKELEGKVYDSKLSNKVRNELCGDIRKAIMDISCNLEFVTKQFGEHMEATVESAKSELAAYIQSVCSNAGLPSSIAADARIVTKMIPGCQTGSTRPRSPNNEAE